MTYWLIVPFSRPTFYQDVLANHARQELQNTRLLFVCNREARGFRGNHGTFIESVDGLAEPMNAGLAYARQHGKPGDWFCKWDDDDYYGPKFLVDVQKGKELGAGVVGKFAVWIRISNDRLWFLDAPQDRWFADQEPHGPTLAGPLDCADFPHRDHWGEDTAWVRLMREAGHRVWLGPARSFCWKRYGKEHSHAFPFTDLALAGMQTYPVLDTGMVFGSDRDHVDNRSIAPFWSAVVKPSVEEFAKEAFDIPLMRDPV